MVWGCRRRGPSVALCLSITIALAHVFPRAAGRSMLEVNNAIDGGYFEVSIESSEGYMAIMSNPAPVFVVDFGRNITQKNPLKLFDIVGSNRVDVVYSQSLGLMYVMAAVSNKDSAGQIKLTVHQGVTQDFDGVRNGFAELSVMYSPGMSIMDSSIISDIAGWGMLGGLAMSFGATMISPTATIGIGAMNFAGFVQTFYMSGNLPISNMPENYRAATHGTVASWVLLNPPVGPVAPESVDAQDIVGARDSLADLSVRFPYPPVNVTSQDLSKTEDNADTQSNGAISQMPAVTAGEQGAAKNSSLMEPNNEEKLEAEPLSEDDLVDENGKIANPFIEDNESSKDNLMVDTSSQDAKKETADDAKTPDRSEEREDSSDTDKKDEDSNDTLIEEGKFTKDVKEQSALTKEDEEDDDEEDESERSEKQEGNKNNDKDVVVDDVVVDDDVDDDDDDGDDDDYEEEEEIENEQYNVVEALMGGKDGDDDGDLEEVLYDDENYVYNDPNWLAIVTNPDLHFWESINSPDKEDIEGSTGDKDGQHKEEEEEEEQEALLDQVNQDIDTNKHEDIKKEEYNTSDEPGAIDGYEENLLEILEEDNTNLRPRETKKGGARRKLLLADPISSLGSSGFSYVIVSATSSDFSNNTIVEQPSDTVGASILSRIRSIEVSGNGAPSDSQRLDILWNVLFWSSILLVAIFAVHLSIIVLIKKVAKCETIPKMLHIPRLELLAFTMILPMIAAAGASALNCTSAGAISAGVFFGILLPFGYLFGASIFLVLAIIRPTISKRKAVYVVHQDMNIDSLGNTTNLQESSTVESSESSETGLEASMLSHQMRHDMATEEDAPPAQERPNASKFLHQWLLHPLFGVKSLNLSNESGNQDPTWLGRAKIDASFVKRYGCLFEDTHGPQVCRVSSRYENSQHNTETVGGGILVPVRAEGVMDILQAFGIIFAATKMVLFAVIINAPGGVNNIAQVVILAFVALLHIFYLRICAPYRIRIELATEILAAVCDMGVFICGIILVTVETWSSASRNNMGTAMLVLQAVGFLVFISVRICLALRTATLTLGPMAKCWYKARQKT